MSRGAVRPSLVSGTGSLVASQIISADGTVLEELLCTNTSGVVVYCQIFNSATLPADATTPDLVFAVPATASASLDLSQGLPLSAGCTVCVSTTAHTKTIAGAVAVFSAVLEVR
jgi:hypothetical protein